MKKILITGFDPFGGEAINPSWEAVKRMQVPEGMELYKLQVP
ncbi:MAG: pyroglutamyl-peptidase I, partial [Spirochaetia bacterium]|nr:pyroglutamyl-peptidase I [Spirochaetia bacterium]